MRRIGFLIWLIFISYCVAGQTADFTYTSTKGSFCSPTTVQFDPVVSGSPVGYIWDFGNNMHSNYATPTTTYAGSGTYLVKLLIVFRNTTMKVSKTVVINPAVKAAIVPDKKQLCQPGNIRFSSTNNANVSSYTWQFGDGTPDEITTVNNVTHNYASFGSYTATLTVSSDSGCTATATTAITVQKPAIAHTISSTSGCIPANIKFTATASTLPGDAVNNYTWNFGDGGGPVSGPSGTISHVYGAVGKYLPTVSITTNSGCTNSYAYSQIAFGIPPTNLVTYTPDSVICGSERAVFIGKATNANSYAWVSGEDVTTVSDTITSHKYKTLGLKSVRVRPYFNGCPGSTDSFKVRIIGVIANYTFKNTCSDRRTFAFQNTSQGNLSSVAWNFGDGSPIDSNLNTTHTYADTGMYVSSLFVRDSITGCVDSLAQKIYIRSPSVINSDTTLCRNDTTTFIVLNELPTSSTLFTWNVLGDTSVRNKLDTFLVAAKTFGVFRNNVIITNGSSYCNDTLNLPGTITVSGPIASYATRDSICLSDSISVTNTSKPFFATDSITLYQWNFRDGAIDSVFQPAPHHYKRPGVYNTVLTATDINGCSNTYTKILHISNDAFVYTFPKIDTLCAGQADTLIAYQNDSLIWTPSNLVSCIRCDTITVSPPQNTMYYATSTNAFGCVAQDSVLVKVGAPFTATAPQSDLYICQNDTITLHVSPPDKIVLWTPSTGLSNPSSYTPIASPLQNTTYTAALTDSFACFTSSVDVNVHVKSLPTVDAGPDQFYPFNSPFTISPTYASNVASYLWTPSTQLNCTTCASPSGTLLKSQTYTITVTSDSGCVATDSVRLIIECKDSYLLIPNAFTPNGDNINDNFYPITRGIETVLNFSVYNRLGQLVFQKTNFPPNQKLYGWNGTFSGEDQPTGVYVYTFQALCDSGERINKKGTVVLIR